MFILWETHEVRGLHYYHSLAKFVVEQALHEGCGVVLFFSFQ